MKAKTILAAVAGSTILAAAMPAVAHHATSTFYSEEVIEMTGEIVEVVWSNPHGVIVLQDETGEYFIGEMASVLSLAQQGLGSAELPVGLNITVDALPARNGTNRIHIETIRVDGEFIYGTPDT